MANSRTSSVLKLTTVTVLIVPLLLSGCLSPFMACATAEYTESTELTLQVETQGAVNGSWELWISAPEDETILSALVDFDPNVLRIVELPTNASWVEGKYLENSTDNTTTFVVISGNGTMDEDWTTQLDYFPSPIDEYDGNTSISTMTYVHWDGRYVDTAYSAVMLYGDGVNEVSFTFTVSGSSGDGCGDAGFSGGFENRVVDTNSTTAENILPQHNQWSWIA